jgi:hypothetical protein
MELAPPGDRNRTSEIEGWDKPNEFDGLTCWTPLKGWIEIEQDFRLTSLVRVYSISNPFFCIRCSTFSFPFFYPERLERPSKGPALAPPGTQNLEVPNFKLFLIPLGDQVALKPLERFHTFYKPWLSRPEPGTALLVVLRREREILGVRRETSGQVSVTCSQD